jgi:F0F1-type ATP synthase assembly protein I|tara:strand:+ start:549 stop:800 length:252 start_codon:yes stop_codon:yes gene_type:complete
MSEQIQTVLETTKIVAKFAATLVIMYTGIFVSTKMWEAAGVHESVSGVYGGMTVFVPFLLFIGLTIAWSQAKHIVWKRNNNIE